MEASAAPAPSPKPRGAIRLASPRLLRLASDERLVAQVRAGSQAAYEAIYDRHHRGILSFCRHMLGSREEAEDAVQHTFMAAYRDLVRSDKDMQLRAWLYAVARNRCVSQLRARRERPAADLGEPATDGLAAEVQRRADLREVLRDLGDLPEDQRAALVLSELGDLGHDEIGAVIGCPRDKVKALVFQARSSLQRSRQARDTSCQDIREMLATLTGGALRRTELRRHLGQCAGCRDFETEVRRQRRAMAAVLPVVPTLALKDTALAAAFAGKGASAGAAAAGAAAVGAGGGSAVVAKVLAVAAIATGGSVAGYEAVSGGGSGREATPAGAKGGAQDAPAPPASGARGNPDKVSGREAEPRRRGHSDRGREFAKTRGKGRKHGLVGTQPGRAMREERRAARQERAAAREQARTDRRPRRPGNRGRSPRRRRLPPSSRRPPLPPSSRRPPLPPTSRHRARPVRAGARAGPDPSAQRP